MTTRRLLYASTAPPPPPEELPTLAQHLALWFNEEFAVRLWVYTEPTWPPLARTDDGWKVMHAIIQLKSSGRFNHESMRFVRERIDLTYLALLLEQLTGCKNVTGVLSCAARNDEFDDSHFVGFTMNVSFQLCVEYVVDEPIERNRDTIKFLDLHDHEPSLRHNYLLVRSELEQRLFVASPTWTRHLEQFPVRIKFALSPCDPQYSSWSNNYEIGRAVQFVRALNAPRDPPPAYRRVNFPGEGQHTYLPLTGRFASIIIPRTHVVTTDFVLAVRGLEDVAARKCYLKFRALDPTKVQCSQEEVNELQRLLAKFQHTPIRVGNVLDYAPDDHDDDHDAPPNAS